MYFLYILMHITYAVNKFKVIPLTIEEFLRAEAILARQQGFSRPLDYYITTKYT